MHKKSLRKLLKYNRDMDNCVTESIQSALKEHKCLSYPWTRRKTWECPYGAGSATV